MASKKIIYLCNHIADSEREAFHFLDAALKKIRGYKSILEAHDIEVQFLSVSPPKPQFFQQRSRFFRTFPHRFLYYLFRIGFVCQRFFRYLWYLTRERKRYDSIMSYSYTTQKVLLACFAHYVLNKRVVLDYEDGLFCHKTRYWYYSRLEKLMLNVAAGSILVNEGLKTRLPERMPWVVIKGIFGAQSHAMHSEKHPSKEPCENQARTPEGQKRTSVLYSGLLSFDRGLALLFEVMSSPSAQQLDFHITGMGADKKFLDSFIAEHHLTNIHVHGYIPLEDLQRLEQKVDGFIICQNEDSSDYETNFPSKLFYYLSSGKPVFFNRCALFAEFEVFDNAFPLQDLANGASKILTVCTTQRSYYPEIFAKMDAYNHESVQQLQRILFT